MLSRSSLLSYSHQSVTQHQLTRVGNSTHVDFRYRLARRLLKHFPQLIRAQHLAVRKHHLVQRSRVDDDACNKAPDIAIVDECIWRRPVADDLVERVLDFTAHTAGWELWECELVPPADVDYGEGEVEAFDFVEEIFFLVPELVAGR